MKSMYSTKIYSILVLSASLFLLSFSYIIDTQAATCSISSANWSKTSSTVGSSIDLVVGGNNCIGKEVTLNIWQRNKDGLSDSVTTIKAIFDTPGVSAGATALAHWTIDGSKTGKVSKPPYDTNYEFYFVAKCSSENCGTRTSGSLFVPISSSTCILTPESPRWVSQDARSTGLIIAYVGSPITLKVDGQGCDGHSVSFDIYNETNNKYITTVKSKFANGMAVSSYTFTTADYIKGGNSPLAEQVIFKTSVFDASGNKLAQAIGQAMATQIDLYPTSNPNPSVPGTSQGVKIINFDISPKQIPVGNTGKILITYKLSVSDPTQAKQYCSNSSTFIWYVNISTNTGTQELRSGQLSWPSSSRDYNLDFEDPFNSVSNGTVNFTGAVKCGSGGKELDRWSKSVSLTVGTGGTGTGGCGTPGQPECKPGENQNYSFEIPNPLKGGADDFSGLVKIIAQWIFNLAIPIAVAMIVYAGILFLISAGDTSKVTKAKQVLTYAVVGLAIILIGNGFVTLIQSILKLGETGQETQQGPGAPEEPGEEYGPPAPGAVGNKCSRDRDCFAGLKCKNTICTRPTGNWVGEPCNGGASCDIGLACDQTSEGRVFADSTLGSCFETSANGGRVGDVCIGDKDCLSGLKCNQICQRKDGNLNDESCLKTSNPSNCKSKACKTTGTATEGVCVDNSSSNPSGPVQQYQNNLIITGLEVNLGAPVNQPHRVELEVENPFSASQIYNWAVVSGSLPPGMVLTSSSVANAGQISGTATRVGSYDVTIQAMDTTHKQYGRYSIQIHIR